VFESLCVIYIYIYKSL